MAATAAEVRAVLKEVGAGGDTAAAGKRLKQMGLPAVQRAERDAVLAGEDVEITPGSISEVYLAQARGEITAEQESEILAAYLA